MSGPTREADTQDASRVTNAPGLSARQWQALARLADRYAALEEGATGALGEAADGAAPMREALRGTLDRDVIDRVGPLIQELRAERRAVQELAARLDAWQALLAGPSGTALASGFMRALDATRDADVAGLGRDALRLAEALSQTGALGWLADNMAYLTDTIRRLSFAAPAAMEAAGPLLDGARDDLLFAHRLAAMGRALGEILAGPTGAAITGMLADVGRWSRANDPAALARELTELLNAWREAGVFPLLREAGGVIAELAASWKRLREAGDEGDAAAQALFADAARGADAWRRWRGEQAAEPGPAPGGLKGLYRLLTDARVQDGLREATALLGALRTPRAQTAAPGQATRAPNGA